MQDRWLSPISDGADEWTRGHLYFCKFVRIYASDSPSF